ncbi:lactonase family protein [Flavobacterium fluviatile]|uniref:lactonase family protein n=1 Tax=Flavobacterium fluviatile TaxID=1862387 RepID=UPI0013D66EE6|nr:lactonase family protein [Flavobacterium fluviatile]
MKPLLLKKKLAIFFMTSILLSSCKVQEHTLLFVGSYTDKKPAKGIKVYNFNLKTGEAILTDEVDSIINPSFLRLAPNGKYLYSVLESQMPTNGKVAAFQIDIAQGKLKLLTIQDAGGRNPAHLEIDKSGKHLVASNYADPSLSVFKIKPDGSLNKFNQFFTFSGSSIIKVKQETSHIHSSNFFPDNEALLVQDLGTDKMYQFKVIHGKDDFFEIQKAGEIKVKTGSGPRHFTFHPNGKFAYGVTEFSGEVLAYNTNQDQLDFLAAYKAYETNQTIYSGADIHISPDGKFLYASNRGPNEHSIVIFAVNQKEGTLKLVGHEPTYGEHPRNFAIDPSGNFLLVANQYSNSIVVFRRDSKTGKLQKLPKEITVPSPSSLQMRSYK